MKTLKNLKEKQEKFLFNIILKKEWNINNREKGTLERGSFFNLYNLQKVIKL